MRLSKFLLFVIPLFYFSCKTQKISTSSSEKTQVDSLIVELPKIDTVIIEEVQDSVEIFAHRLLKDTIIITAVGDMMLGTNYPNDSYLPPNEGKNQLAQIDSLLAGGDILFGNLEGVILNEGGIHKNCNNPKTCYIFRSPEYMLTRIKEAGFN
ncbi:Capsule biosynthesis protein capA, partial [hydrothermal vent metagenome]